MSKAIEKAKQLLAHFNKARKEKADAKGYWAEPPLEEGELLLLKEKVMAQNDAAIDEHRRQEEEGRERLEAMKAEFLDSLTPAQVALKDDYKRKKGAPEIYTAQEIQDAEDAYHNSLSREQVDLGDTIGRLSATPRSVVLAHFKDELLATAPAIFHPAFTFERIPGWDNHDHAIALTLLNDAVFKCAMVGGDPVYVLPDVLSEGKCFALIDPTGAATKLNFEKKVPMSADYNVEDMLAMNAASRLRKGSRWKRVRMSDGSTGFYIDHDESQGSFDILYKVVNLYLGSDEYKDAVDPDSSHYIVNGEPMSERAYAEYRKEREEKAGILGTTDEAEPDHVIHRLVLKGDKARKLMQDELDVNFLFVQTAERGPAL